MAASTSDLRPAHVCNAMNIFFEESGHGLFSNNLYLVHLCIAVNFLLAS